MKLYNFVIIMLGIMILFNAAGYNPPVGGMVKKFIIGDDSECSSPPCTKIESIQHTKWYTDLNKVLKLAASVGVIAGLYFTLPSISYLIAGLLSFFLGLFMVDLIWLYTKIIEHGEVWMIFLMTSIFAPLLIGFIITAIEWWQGSD